MHACLQYRLPTAQRQARTLLGGEAGTEHLGALLLVGKVDCRPHHRLFAAAVLLHPCAWHDCGADTRLFVKKAVVGKALYSTASASVVVLGKTTINFLVLLLAAAIRPAWLRRRLEKCERDAFRMNLRIAPAAGVDGRLRLGVSRLLCSPLPLCSLPCLPQNPIMRLARFSSPTHHPFSGPRCLDAWLTRMSRWATGSSCAESLQDRNT